MFGNISPNDGPADDLVFRCARCSEPYLSWRAEVGQRRCRYHPGVSQSHVAGERSFAYFTCCGLMPEVCEALGRMAAGVNLSKTAAIHGCTRCDHAPEYEELADPVYFIAVPTGVPSAHIARVTDKSILAQFNDLYRFTDTWWATTAPKAAIDRWKAKQLDAEFMSAALSRNKSWLPRGITAYDVAEVVATTSRSSEADTGPNGEFISDPMSRKLFEEARTRAKRVWVRRLAFGLPPTGAFPAEAQSRASTLLPTEMVPPTAIYAVTRRDPLPTEKEVKANFQRCCSYVA